MIHKSRNPKTKCLSLTTVYGKPSSKQEDSVADALQETPIDNKSIVKWKYLQYLHKLRDNLKKRIPSIDYFDIYEDLVCLDKEDTGILSEEDVFTILNNYKIYPERELFEGLLDLLVFRQNNKLFYKNVVDLLNWKTPFPTLPITKNISESKEEVMSSLNKDENKSYITPSKYYPCNENLYSKIDNAYALIFPSTFTKYNLNHIDFFKLRSKEEIRNIFENIGITFPDNTFDILWEKAIQKDGNEGVCIDTFNTLLDVPTNSM
ncbi:hypothetical protein M0802_008578 [Mischocyttarus mexicanus]|nr:hypothetical protein M0802_008578 [Mischocyttarus mexicanus]